MKKDRYFKLYSCCIAVRGLVRSCIYDLQKETFELIPNALFDILEQNIDSATLKRYSEDLSSADFDILESYFEFLVENDLGKWWANDEKEDFQKISLEWKDPAFITNAVIDFDFVFENGKIDIRIVQELESLGCQYFELVTKTVWEQDLIKQFMDQIRNSSIKQISLVFPFERNSLEFYKILLETNSRITSVILHNSPCDKEHFDSKVISTKQNLEDTLSAPVNPKLFQVNYALFSESLTFNSYYNRKVYISKNGNVRNGLNTQVVGNAKTTSIKELIAIPDFYKLWSITKDKIETCKDCEFRYMCTDSSTLVETIDGLYKRESKCSYNPATATWDND